MSTATIRRALREQFGPRGYRISKNGFVQVYGPLPLAPHLVDWHLHGRIIDGALELLMRPEEHAEH